MSSDYVSVSQEIRSYALAQKAGSSVQQLDNEYRDLNGRGIPYARLGFDSMEALFDKLRKGCIVTMSVSGGQHIVHGVTSGELQHVTDLVARTKSKQPVRSKRTNGGYVPQAPPRRAYAPAPPPAGQRQRAPLTQPVAPRAPLPAPPPSSAAYVRGPIAVGQQMSGPFLPALYRLAPNAAPLFYSATWTNGTVARAPLNAGYNVPMAAPVPPPLASVAPQQVPNVAPAPPRPPPPAQMAQQAQAPVEPAPVHISAAQVADRVAQLVAAAAGPLVPYTRLTSDYAAFYGRDDLARCDIRRLVAAQLQGRIDIDYDGGGILCLRRASPAPAPTAVPIGGGAGGRHTPPPPAAPSYSHDGSDEAPAANKSKVPAPPNYAGYTAPPPPTYVSRSELGDDDGGLSQRAQCQLAIASASGASSSAPPADCPLLAATLIEVMPGAFNLGRWDELNEIDFADSRRSYTAKLVKFHSCAALYVMPKAAEERLVRLKADMRRFYGAEGGWHDARYAMHVDELLRWKDRRRHLYGVVRVNEGDDEPTYCRARVDLSTVEARGATARVLQVDYGDEETLALADVKKLHATFAQPPITLLTVGLQDMEHMFEEDDTSVEAASYWGELDRQVRDYCDDPQRAISVRLAGWCATTHRLSGDIVEKSPHTDEVLSTLSSLLTRVGVELATRVRRPVERFDAGALAHATVDSLATWVCTATEAADSESLFDLYAKAVHTCEYDNATYKRVMEAFALNGYEPDELHDWYQSAIGLRQKDVHAASSVSTN